MGEGEVAQDVLKLFRGAGHFIAPSHGQDLNKAHIEKYAFEDNVKRDQFPKQSLVVFRCTGLE